MQRMNFLLIAALMLALAPAYGRAPASQAPSTPAITVTIDGKSVVFTGTQPQEIKDAVMVPLRGVFQQMGATVNYDEPTHTIKAQGGATTISLPIGSSTAMVNGQSETLSQPAVVVDGATLVPLRFVAQSFGAYVEWNAVAHSVKIVTPAAHLTQLPAPPASLGPNFVGQLIAIDQNASPMRVSLRDEQGEVVSLPIDPSADLTLMREGQPQSPAAINSLQPGDQIMVTRDASGAAADLSVIFGRVVGIIKSISVGVKDTHTINLTDGLSVVLAAGAPVTMSHRYIALSEVMAAEHVVIRTSPDNKTGYGMAVVTANDLIPNPPGAAPTAFFGGHLKPTLAADQSAPAGPPVAIAVSVTSFTADVSAPVKAGDKVSVTLLGTPGGKATAAIPGFLTDIPLTEAQPGEYTGALTIPKGLSATGAAILGKLVAAGTPSPLMPARATVTIDNEPPLIFDQCPPANSTVAMARPLIFAALSDGAGAGVNSGSVRVSVDGQDVTGQAQVTPSYAAYRPAAPLGAGSHTVDLTAADLVGNPAKSEWHFRVAGSDQEPLSRADREPVSTEHPLDLTLNGWPGSVATFSVGSDPGQIPMKEAQTGVHRAFYSPSAGAGATRAAVVAEIKPATGDAVLVTLAAAVPVLAAPPDKPKIVSPGEDVPLEDSVQVAGSARPGQWVLVAVTYSSRAAAGLFEIDGTAASLAARADAKGHWKTDTFTLKLPWLLTRDRTTRFIITAKAVDEAGQESEADKVQVMHE